jgi:hypothetical protein
VAWTDLIASKQFDNVIPRVAVAKRERAGLISRVDGHHSPVAHRAQPDEASGQCEFVAPTAVTWMVVNDA